MRVRDAERLERAPARCAAARAARSGRARSSTPPAPGRRSSSREHAHVADGRARCAWSRAATSSCRSCSTTTMPTSSRTPTGRIIFAIPYEGDFTLIGTTDVEHQRRRSATARIDASEIDYLCDQASRYFAQAGRARRCGVDLLAACARCSTTSRAIRPAVTRDYRSSSTRAAAPLLSVWGGKITTYRRLAEDAADRTGRTARPAPGAPGQPTRRCPVAISAAGSVAAVRPDTDFDRFVQALAQRHPELAPLLARRLARGYGARVGAARRRPRRRDRARSARGRTAPPAPITNGREPRRTCCGGAPSSVCT